MSDLALSLRLARPADAAPLARVYVEAWQDTYAAILPHSLLSSMSVGVHTARIDRAIRKGAVLVAEDARHGAIGLAGFGAARDRGLGFDGEVYTLYVAPAFLGRGVGRSLLHGAFAALKARAFQSCLIWSHAQNNACFFYEAMGGVRSGNRQIMMGGQDVSEVAFGWKQLAVSRRKLTTWSQLDKTPPPISLAAARNLSWKPGHSAEVFIDGEMEIRFTGQPTKGMQVPHDRDEFYIIASGTARYRVGDTVTDVGPGDLLFAAAHAPHGFEEYSDDFAIWIGFYGPVK